MASGERSRASRTWPLYVALGGALLLPLSLFFDWYKYPSYGGLGQLETHIYVTGWEAFELADAFLVFAAVGACVIVLAELRSSPVVSDWAVCALGAAILFVVALQLIDKPFRGPGVSVLAGAWAGLAGAPLVFLGGLAHFLVTAERTMSQAAGQGVDRPAP
jgi:hypothetical protein